MAWAGPHLDWETEGKEGVVPASIDTIIDRQLRRWELERRSSTAHAALPEGLPRIRPVITVSRQHGTSGAHIAARLASHFRYTLLHRNIIDRMCESSGLTHRLLAALDEHARSEITSWFDSILVGKYVDAGDYAQALLRTVRSIAELGGVVVVGRGANFIVGLERGFHVRIVAPRSSRLETLMARRGVSEKEAARELDARDRDREQFIRQLFGRSVNDPLGYDLTINEAGLPEQTVVDIVAATAVEKLRKLRGETARQPA